MAVKPFRTEGLENTAQVDKDQEKIELEEVIRDEKLRGRRIGWCQKKHVCFVYWCMGYRGEELAKASTATQTTVGQWKTEFEVHFNHMVTRGRMNLLNNTVSEEDLTLHNKNVGTVKSVLNRVNKQLDMEDEMFNKIQDYIDRLSNTKEPLTEKQTEMMFKYLDYFKGRTTNRGKLIDQLLKLKKSFEEDSAIDVEKELRKTRKVESEKILVAKRIDEFKEKQKRGEVESREFFDAKAEGVVEANEFLAYDDEEV